MANTSTKMQIYMFQLEMMFMPLFICLVDTASTQTTTSRTRATKGMMLLKTSGRPHRLTMPVAICTTPMPMEAEMVVAPQMQASTLMKVARGWVHFFLGQALMMESPGR